MTLVHRCALVLGSVIFGQESQIACVSGGRNSVPGRDRKGLAAGGVVAQVSALPLVEPARLAELSPGLRAVEAVWRNIRSLSKWRTCRGRRAGASAAHEPVIRSSGRRHSPQRASE